MLERLEVHTTKKSSGQVLADYFETTIYDRLTGNSVVCAGDTPTDSRANAEKYLAVLNSFKDSHVKAKGELSISLMK